MKGISLKNIGIRVAFGLTVLVVASLILSGRAYAAPSTQTLPASAISQNSVTLNGVLNPNGENTTFWFEYGTSFGLGQITSQQNAGNPNAQITVYHTLYGGLVPNTTYYYRLVAQSPSGVAQGQILTFQNGNGGGNNGCSNCGSAPTVSNAIAQASNNAVSLRTQVNPNGALSSVWFEYGRTAALGGVTTRDPAGSGNSATDYIVTIRGLSPGTIYYYRPVAQNQYGVNRGQIASFQTSGTPAIRPSTPPRSNPTSTPPTVPNTPTTPPVTPTPGGVVGAPGCLQVGPTLSSSALNASENFTYSVTYRNSCGTALSNVSLQITLPLAVDFASTNYAFVSRDANVITYNLGSVADNFQAVITVNGKVKGQVNNGDNLLFQADLSYLDARGARQTANASISAVVTAPGQVAGASTSTLGASTADALGGLFHSGWFWLVLFLILVALFVFWLATRGRGDEEDEEDADLAHAH